MARHKAGQGKIVRNSAFVLLLILAVFSYTGCERFFNGYSNYLGKDVYASLSGYDITLPRIVGLVVALVLIFFSWKWTQTKEKSVDFLIDVEGEMRKVVWPINPEGRTIGEKTRELRTSSFVVIGVVMFMAYALYLFDNGFRVMMGMLFGGTT